MKCVWVKVDAACGVRPNWVQAVRILNKDAADPPQFKPLVQTTARRFTVNEVSADKAYASNENFEAVHDVGGIGFLLFKSKTTGGVGGLFEKKFRDFQWPPQDFPDHNHKRGDAGSTFLGGQPKFGERVW